MCNQKSTGGYVYASVNQKPIRHGIMPVTCADILVTTKSNKKNGSEEKNKNGKRREQVRMDQLTSPFVFDFSFVFQKCMRRLNLLPFFFEFSASSPGGFSS